MLKSELREIQKETRADLIKWQKVLFLEGWKINAYFKPNESVEDSSIVAECNIDPAYLQAYIYFYKGYFKSPYEVREHSVVHELCHIYSAELGELAKALLEGELVTKKQVINSVEKLTQRISYAVMRNFKKGKK